MRTDRYWAWPHDGTTITFSSISAKTNERVLSVLNIGVAATLTSKTWMLHARHKLYRWAPIRWWWTLLVHDRQDDGVLFLFFWCDTKMRRLPPLHPHFPQLWLTKWQPWNYGVELCEIMMSQGSWALTWDEMSSYFQHLCEIVFWFMSESGSQRPLTIGSIKLEKSSRCSYITENVRHHLWGIKSHLTWPHTAASAQIKFAWCETKFYVRLMFRINLSWLPLARKPWPVTKVACIMNI